ncbi:MAG: geranylgeranylglyceryl/heptaprenylglyceryl phosphate synthase [candidate division Zixibacteria bacterium HGW-Zixibacteria-1]|nr:MAG: geranylgeranylglyceryl/heptaprenylglyceryl phosphate synthase [candidate division Zixibacteria bacterium HGW-Zixibacteria-1]
MTVYDHLIQTKDKKGGAFLLLLDPDRIAVNQLCMIAERAAECDVDAIMVGTSYVIRADFHETVRQIKRQSSVPLILFPGSHSQISPDVDAILFTSLISGRNPQYLIEEQVRGAPLIREYNLETIPTGYMLIDAGNYTSVQYVSGTFPIPSDKPEIACAHALAAQYMGMRLIYMEAGSGAANSVPESMIQQVSEYVDLPIMVGGGIVNPEQVERKIRSGASFVVVGNHFEINENLNSLREFAQAAHPFHQVQI